MSRLQPLRLAFLHTVCASWVLAPSVCSASQHLPNPGTCGNVAGHSTMASPASPFHSLSALTIKGEEFPFSQLQGKVVLLVNVASKCGFTPQYKGLQQLHDKYKDQGLVILGFPCDQFGHQEPGSESEIEGFCQANYGVSFQMMSKIDVNGDTTHPVYQYLKSQKKQMFMHAVKWNFEKFLVDKEGTVVTRFSSMADPMKDIAPAVAGLL